MKTYHWIWVSTKKGIRMSFESDLDAEKFFTHMGASVSDNNEILMAVEGRIVPMGRLKRVRHYSHTEAIRSHWWRK